MNPNAGGALHACLTQEHLGLEVIVQTARSGRRKKCFRIPYNIPILCLFIKTFGQRVVCLVSQWNNVYVLAIECNDIASLNKVSDSCLHFALSLFRPGLREVFFTFDIRTVRCGWLGLVII